MITHFNIGPLSHLLQKQGDIQLTLFQNLNLKFKKISTVMSITTP